MRKNLSLKAKYCLVISLLAIGVWLNFSNFFMEQWKKFALRNQTIVLSFTTTPHRINAIGPTIDSLLKQNAAIYNIYLSIPHKFKRDNSEYNIPQWLAEHKKITILRTEDYGPATKVLGVLEQVKLPDDAIIISVDDDISYPYNLALELAYKAMQNPNYAIGLMGANPDYDKDGNIAVDSKEAIIPSSKPDEFVKVLYGFPGVAYRRGFFDQAIFKILKAPRACMMNDDLYISFYLAKHNIQRQILASENLSFKDIIFNTPLGLQSDALRNLFPGAERNRACIVHMKQNDPQVLF